MKKILVLLVLVLVLTLTFIGGAEVNAIEHKHSITFEKEVTVTKIGVPIQLQKDRPEVVLYTAEYVENSVKIEVMVASANVYEVGEKVTFITIRLTDLGFSYNSFVKNGVLDTSWHKYVEVL